MPINKIAEWHKRLVAAPVLRRPPTGFIGLNQVHMIIFGVEGDKDTTTKNKLINQKRS